MAVSSYQLEAVLWSHRHNSQIPLTASVLDVQAAKSMATSGSWSLNLGASRLPIPWFEIEDDDWIGISARELGTGREHVLAWGLVDSSRYRKRTGEQAETIVNVAVQGRDFGKAFEVDELLFDVYLQNAAPQIPGLINQGRYNALVNAVQTNRQATPGAAVRRILEILLPGRWFMPAPLGQGKALGDVLNLATDVELGQILNLAGYVPNGTQKLDAYLRRIFSTPFHEWFYDLRPAAASGAPIATGAVPPYLKRFDLVPTVVYRNLLSPYHDGTGAHTIETWEEGDVDIGRSGAERFTMFAASGPAWNAQLTLGLWGQGGGRLPMFDHGADALAPDKARTFATMIARHGLRTLDVHDETAPTSQYGPERKVPIEWIAERTEQLYRHYSNIPRAMSGTIEVTRLRPEIRLGDRVVHRGIGYQVAQVQHVASVGTTALLMGRTTVAVVKGMPVGMKAPAIPAPWKRQ